MDIHGHQIGFQCCLLFHKIQLIEATLGVQGLLPVLTPPRHWAERDAQVSACVCPGPGWALCQGRPRPRLQSQDPEALVPSTRAVNRQPASGAPASEHQDVASTCSLPPSRADTRPS